VSLDLDQLEKLIAVIEEMAAGNLDARYPISSRHDDVDAIGFGVNILAEELSANISRLEREIAERRSAESERAEAERKELEAKEELQALRTARLASIGVLAAGVGHEINNPLTYVIANLTYLQRTLARLVPESAGTAEAELHNVIRETGDGAERIRQIVQDLKLFARIEEEEGDEPLDAREVMESALALVQNEIRHRAQLVRDYRDTPQLAVSEPRLAQVLVNLLVNAAHSIPTGAAGENEIRVAIRPNGDDQIVVEIGDTGAGITPEDLPHVFEPFFSGKPTGEGTGLGLSICVELVSKMGGRIDIDSRIDFGTTVRVTLPVAAVEVEKSVVAAAEPPLPSVDDSTRRILIVDDELPVARSLRRLLDGSDVTIAGGGRQALELLSAGPDFDLVFCDLMMPDMSGMEVFETIRSSRPELAERFVFVTGGIFTELAHDFVAAVPNRCIQKPFQQGQLELLVQECVRSPIS